MSSSTANNHSVSLRITSDPTLLAPARLAIEKLCQSDGFDSKSCEEIGLVVNEAIANVIRHAYANAPDQPIQLDISVRDGELTLAMRDWGKGVNPDKLPPSPASVDPLKPGGLGLMCMRQMMDSVVFEPQSDGMLLTMKRKRRPAGDGAAKASAEQRAK